MTQISGNTVIEVKPQPDVYTVLLLVSIITLGIALGLCLYCLLQPVEPAGGGGYGLEFSQLFDGTLPDGPLP